MKIIQKSLLTVLSVFAFIGITHAQSPEGPKGHVKHKRTAHLEKIAQELGLDEAQKAEFLAIQKEFGEKRRQLKQEDRQVLKEKMEALRGEKNVAMKEVMTKEQFEVYLKKEEEHHQKMKKRRHHPRKGEDTDSDKG